MRPVYWLAMFTLSRMLECNPVRATQLKSNHRQIAKKSHVLDSLEGLQSSITIAIKELDSKTRTPSNGHLVGIAKLSLLTKDVLSQEK